MTNAPIKYTPGTIYLWNNSRNIRKRTLLQYIIPVLLNSLQCSGSGWRFYTKGWIDYSCFAILIDFKKIYMFKWHQLITAAIDSCCTIILVWLNLTNIPSVVGTQPFSNQEDTIHRLEHPLTLRSGHGHRPYQVRGKHRHVLTFRYTIVHEFCI